MVEPEMVEVRADFAAAAIRDAARIAALEAQLAEAERRKQELEREVTGLRNSYFEERKARIALEPTPPAPKVTEAEAGAKLANAMWGITLTAAQESGE